MTTSSLPAAVRRVAERLRGGLVVSCQARPGEPLHGPHHMAAMAASVVAGGAIGLRVEGVDDVRAVSQVTAVPLIGLWKDGADDVYITPTLAHAVAVADAGATLVAIDGTGRPRPDGAGLAETIEALHERGVLVVADVSTYEEGMAAAAVGADLVATTLAGYTSYSAHPGGPDLDLLAGLARDLNIPVIAEGRFGTPAQARRAIDLGAWCVVVGAAITRPSSIAATFASALSAEQEGP